MIITITVIKGVEVCYYCLSHNWKTFFLWKTIV